MLDSHFRACKSFLINCLEVGVFVVVYSILCERKAKSNSTWASAQNKLGIVATLGPNLEPKLTCKSSTCKLGHEVV